MHSAETLANLSVVLGAASAAPEAARDAGTKLITVRWQDDARVVEVPFGTTLRTVLRQVIGLEPDDEEGTVVQFGGPTGRFYHGETLDTPIDYEEASTPGVCAGSAIAGPANIGSATLQVFAPGLCGVALARDATSYLRDQSCGACVVCREGTRQMAELVDEVASFRARAEDVDLLVELAAAMKAGSICGLGRTAGDPVLSSLELFGADFAAHIHEKRCPGGQGHD